MVTPANPTVLVIQRHLTHYRVPFFEALRAELARRQISLRLACGSPTEAEKRKNDAGHLPWAEALSTRYFLQGQVCWQPFGHLLPGIDLVVVTAENKLLYNLWLQTVRHGLRVALWGHGANLQGDPRSLRERFKRLLAKRADWWFAYTQMSVPLIERSGFPRERITVLDNAVDSAELIALRLNATPEVVRALRQRLGLVGDNVAVFVGSIYAEKRIDFMLQAALEMRRRVPDFELLVVGSGPQEDLVKAFCAGNPWARHLGQLKGQDKVDVVASARVMLNPGLVGLGILDSFACGVPLTTTDCGLHSPEIAYLDSGVNGLMTPDTLEAYVAGVVSLLEQPQALQRLRDGCMASAAKYTIANMASNFADGVEACLRAPGKPGSSDQRASLQR